MARQAGKRLVIDACVAQAAGGEDATFPLSKQCRDFLRAVYEICHRLVLTPEIRDEWKQHSSRFTRKWLRWMDGPRKIDRLGSAIDQQLRDDLEKVAGNRSDADNMLKDVHLIEAALATDQTVVSWEKRSRKLFAAAAARLASLGSIVWVDPSIQSEDTIAWLKEGAKPENHRKLADLS